MLKLILADSDVVNVSKIADYIEKRFDKFYISAKVHSFDNLMESIRMVNPDVILVEFSLFGVNYYRLIKDITEVYPNCKIILYGAGHELLQMKKCIELGVFNYILRPVKPSILTMILRQLVEYFYSKSLVIDDPKDAILEEYKKSVSVFEQNFLQLLVNGKLASSSEILKGFEYFNFKISPNYRVAVVIIDHFRDIIIDFTERDKHLFVYKIMKVVKEITNSKVFLDGFNKIVVILGESYELDSTLSLFNEIKIRIKSELDVDVSVGLGRAYENPTKISTSFDEGINAIRYRCVEGYNKVIAIEHVDYYTDNMTYSNLSEIESSLAYSAVIGEVDYSIYLLNVLFREFRQNSNINNSLISQILTGIIISINRISLEKGVKNVKVNDFFPLEKIISFDTVESAYNIFEDALRNYCHFIYENRQEVENEIFNNAVEYIEEKYFDEINHTTCANSLDCPVEYFKGVFKKKSSLTFDKYVSKFRIEKACQLMKENLDDKTVALKIGYGQDIGPFKAEFRKIVGKSTFEYRTALRTNYTR